MASPQIGRVSSELLWPDPFEGKTCRTCKHRRMVDVSDTMKSRYISYCEKQYSGKTYNKLKKIKARDQACGFYEECK